MIRVRIPTPATIPMTSTPHTTRMMQIKMMIVMYLINDLTKEEMVLAFLDLLSNKWVINVAMKIKVMAIKTKIKEIIHLVEPSIIISPSLIHPLAIPSPNKRSPISSPKIALEFMKTMKPAKEMKKMIMPMIKLVFCEVVFLDHQLSFLTSTMLTKPPL